MAEKSPGMLSVAARFLIALLILGVVFTAAVAICGFIANISDNISISKQGLDEWALTQNSQSKKWQWDVLNVIVSIALPGFLAGVLGWFLLNAGISGLLGKLDKLKPGTLLVLVSGTAISALTIALSVIAYRNGAELLGVDAIGPQAFQAWLLGPDRGYFPRKFISNWAWSELVPSAALFVTGVTGLIKAGGLALDRLHRWLP